MGSNLVGLVYHEGNYCLDGTLELDLVHGKIVICDTEVIRAIEKGLVVCKAGP